MPIVEEQYPIPDCPGYYITKSGVVWSHKRKEPFRMAISMTIPNGETSYPSVQLSLGSRKRFLTIHRALALTFIPNPHNLPMVRHKDYNCMNYSLNNLEWSKPIDINQKALKLFRDTNDKRKSRNRTKLRLRIKAEYATGKVTLSMLAKKYKMGVGTIGYITRSRGDWKAD
jgi:hypothetical protein